MRAPLVIALLLAAPSARAQLPPWAGHPVVPTPAFLVVPAAPELEEPEQVRVMRDAHRAALGRQWHSLELVELMDRRADARWMQTQSILDPASVVPTSDEVRSLARSVVELDGDAEAILARAGEPARVSQDALVQRSLLLEIVRRLIERGQDHAAFDVADRMVERFPCTDEAWSAYQETAVRCHHSFAAAEALCARRPGGLWPATSPSWSACEAPAIQARVDTVEINLALRLHQRATHARRESVVEHDEAGARLARELFLEVEAAYVRFFERRPPERFPDGYTLLYNLADAQFWSGQPERAAATYTRVRDWSWRDGRSNAAGEYGAEAARRVAEARAQLLEAAVARDALALPDAAPEPRDVPAVVGELMLAREIYLARFPDDPEHVGDAFALANAELLERYGYWDEARSRYAAVTSDEARDAMVRMATALGDRTEAERVLSSYLR